MTARDDAGGDLGDAFMHVKRSSGGEQVHRLFGAGGDAVPVAGLDHLGGGASQEPPTAATFFKASQLGASASVMPPVGQNTTCGNGPARDFKAGMPPAGTAGKNFISRSRARGRP